MSSSTGSAVTSASGVSPTRLTYISSRGVIRSLVILTLLITIGTPVSGTLRLDVRPMYMRPPEYSDSVKPGADRVASEKSTPFCVPSSR